MCPRLVDTEFRPPHSKALSHGHGENHSTSAAGFWSYVGGHAFRRLGPGANPGNFHMRELREG